MSEMFESVLYVFAEAHFPDAAYLHVSRRNGEYVVTVPKTDGHVLAAVELIEGWRRLAYDNATLTVEFVE